MEFIMHIGIPLVSIFNIWSLSLSFSLLFHLKGVCFFTFVVFFICPWIIIYKNSKRWHSPFSAGNVSISIFCLLALNRELIWRRSFFMNGPPKFIDFVIDVCGGGGWLLCNNVAGATVVVIDGVLIPFDVA